MKKWWWKILCVILLVYTLKPDLVGFVNEIPRLSFTGIDPQSLLPCVHVVCHDDTVYGIGGMHAVKYLRTNDLKL